MGPVNRKYKPSRLFLGFGKQILLVLVALGITVWVYSLYHHHQQQANLFKVPEENAAKFADQDLKNKDYNSYQLRLDNEATGYISIQKYDDAKRVLNEVTTNVPSNKIISNTYRAYWYLYQQTGDVKDRKKYAELTAEKLKQEGQNKAAAAFEADAK